MSARRQANDGNRRTVVVTGASAGVGRATALAFGRQGWNVALLARRQKALDDAAQDVERAGGRALAISVDVADAEALFNAAERVVTQWGAIDVWVNNAMVTVFSPVDQLSPAEFRRVTEVAYLGYVFGTMAALRHMRRRNAGTIVQVGSALGYRAVPLQSAYCGAKFAIRGFTDALRSELRHERSSIRITAVELPAVNTPQFDWARNKLGRKVQPLPPIHQPAGIADVIVRAAERAPREVWVGISAMQAILATMAAPGLLDRVLSRKGYEGQVTGEPRPGDAADNLFEPSDGHAINGRFGREARKIAPSVNPAFIRGAIGLLAALLFIGWAAVLLRG